jgi:hypothetical protein
MFFKNGRLRVADPGVTLREGSGRRLEGLGALVVNMAGALGVAV